ncbi:MAG: GNAT family N-acetyltransferase [Clostridia bacterium]|nr:GNAT family N-acetyltransferase [Clostridia bacterium]
MNDKKFQNYYYKYLEYKKMDSIIRSINREKKINNFYYPIIVSKINDTMIYSITPKYFKEVKKGLQKGNIKDLEEVKKKFELFFKANGISIEIQTMLRMSKNIENFDMDISNVTEIKEKNKFEYFNSFNKIVDMEYKNSKWEKFKDYQYLNGIIKDNKFVSVGFVSNIDYNGANIVIQTKKEYQNRGYGKIIVEKISRDLLKDNIIPIYWVNVENIESNMLAKSLGFEEQAVELIVKVI